MNDTSFDKQGRGFRWPAAVYWALLGGVLALALYLRTANLGTVQHFLGDQGRDYFDVMKWLRQGQWPLVGPRRVVGDWGLGPGWYYLLAPAMALSGFHPAAGAATVAMAAVLTIALFADWLRRAAGSRAAALAGAAVMAFSLAWTSLGRTLWSPHVIPLGVVGLAWLITVLPRRPVPCLAGALMLMAILPQWHTPGLLVDAAVLPFLALALRGAWPAARATRRRTWVPWGIALAVVVALLYVPPILYELKPGPGNLVSFFTRSNMPGDPVSGSLAGRALSSVDRLIQVTVTQAFGHHPVLDRPALHAGLAVALGIVFGLILWRGAREAARWNVTGIGCEESQASGSCHEDGEHFNPQSVIRNSYLDLSVGFLALLAAGFWLVLLVKGNSVQDYFLLAPQTALLMLAGWTAGRLLGPSPGGGRWGLAGRLAGGTLLALATVLALAQLPGAWALHGDVTGADAQSLKITRAVAACIARDSAGLPYSVELAEENNFVGHYFYLLHRLGRPPLNDDYYNRLIPRERMGRRIYLIAGPGLAAKPELIDLGVRSAERITIANMTVHRLDASRIAPEVRAVKIGFGWFSKDAGGVTWAVKAVR